MKLKNEFYRRLYERLDNAKHFDEEFFAMSINPNYAIAYQIMY